MHDERIGVVLHDWPRVGAAQVELDHGIVQVGDRIRFRGHAHEFEQDVLSLEIDRVSKSEGYPGEFVSIGVDRPVHEKDEVYIIRRSKLEMSKG